ncbi:dephospho-CoA kinase [Myxococcota bacterium]|nr:dephospho-CoA kinase [Myxococcota bacterium]
MKLFGLTGGIASGKSTVARILREHGVWVLDSDAVAREAVVPQSEGLKAICEAFGEGFLLSDGTLDRKKLGELIFRDPQARQTLNAILHPKIAQISARHIQAYAETGACCAVYEVPLLFENQMQHAFHATLLVAVPEDIQRQRLCQREALSPEAAQARLDAQMPLSQKRALADYVIENDQTLESLRQQTLALWKTLCPEDPHQTT